MEHSNHHREKFISMLKDSILTLCKNGLMDDHGITRVEGLLGITLQNHEVFLINIQEELLPLRELSRQLNNGEHSEGKRTGLKTPQKMSPSIRVKRSSNHPIYRRPSNTKHSRFTSPTREDTTRMDDRGGGRERRDDKTEESSAVEESIQDASNFDVGSSRNGAAAYRERISNELVCMDDVSGMEETSETEASEPLELVHRTKDEPDDIIYNLPGSVIGQLQNLESGFNCTSLVNSSNGIHWSSKDSNDISLPSSLVPHSYLSSMLHFPGQSVSHSSSLSPSSPTFANHASILHPFYADSGMRRSLGATQRHSFKMLNRQNKKYCCDMCNYKSNRSYNLVRHVMHVHSSGRFPCPDCGLVLHNRMQLRGHQLQHHSNDVASSLLDIVKQEPEEAVNA